MCGVDICVTYAFPKGNLWGLLLLTSDFYLVFHIPLVRSPTASTNIYNFIFSVIDLRRFARGMYLHQVSYIHVKIYIYISRFTYTYQDFYTYISSLHYTHQDLYVHIKIYIYRSRFIHTYQDLHVDIKIPIKIKIYTYISRFICSYQDLIYTSRL